MRKLSVLLSIFCIQSCMSYLHALKPRDENHILRYSDHGFVIENKDDLSCEYIPEYQLDKSLRSLNMDQRRKLISKNLIKIHKNNEGESSLSIGGRLLGGGPVMGAILYWVTKVCCWTGVTVAAGAVVSGAVASAVATGGATAAPLAVTGGAIAGTAIKSAMAASIAAAPIAAPAIVTANSIAITAASVATVPGAVAAAKTATVAVAVGAAGKVGLVAGIEAACMNAFAAGLLFPWF